MCDVLARRNAHSHSRRGAHGTCLLVLLPRIPASVRKAAGAPPSPSLGIRLEKPWGPFARTPIPSHSTRLQVVKQSVGSGTGRSVGAKPPAPNPTPLQGAQRPCAPDTRPGGVCFSAGQPAQGHISTVGERGREEKEGEKHQCVVASHVPLTGDLACNPGLCPDQHPNLSPSVCRPAPTWLSHSSQGCRGC